MRAQWLAEQGQAGRRKRIHEAAGRALRGLGPRLDARSAVAERCHRRTRVVVGPADYIGAAIEGCQRRTGVTISPAVAKGDARARHIGEDGISSEERGDGRTRVAIGLRVGQRLTLKRRQPVWGRS